MKTWKIETAAAAALFTVTFAVASCDSGQASADTRKPPGWETVVQAGNDVAYDIASFCNHGNRVYVADMGAKGIAVAPNDPSCAGVAQ